MRLVRAVQDPPSPLPDAESASAVETAGPFLIAKLRAQQAGIEATKPRVLASGDEEAVHDLRVALRRARTILEIGRPVFGRFHADEVRRALGDVHRTTGTLRDEEVVLALVLSLDLGSDPAVAASVAAWVAIRRRRERSLRNGVRRAVQAGKLDVGLRLLDALLTFPVNPARDKRIAKFAKRATDGAKRGVERRRSMAKAKGGDDSEALHRLRIRYKRLRYTVETFKEAAGADVPASLGQSAARFQKLLGEIHDADVALAAVRRGRALPESARAALLHALSEFRAARSQAYELARGEIDESRPAARIYASGTDSLRKTSTR